MAGVPPTVAPPSYPSAQAIAELAREAQLQQLQSLDSLDTKAASLIGLAGVLLGLIFTSSIATSRWSIVLSLGAGLVGASILCLLLVLIPRSARFNPNIVALAPAYMAAPAEETYRVTTASIEQALLFNANLGRWKSGALRLGIAIAVTGLILITIGLIYAAEKGVEPAPAAPTAAHTATIHSG